MRIINVNRRLYIYIYVFNKSRVTYCLVIRNALILAKAVSIIKFSSFSSLIHRLYLVLRFLQFLLNSII